MYLGRQLGQGVRNRFIYTATAGQTTFSGSDDNGIALVYTDGTYVDVNLNGVELVSGTDYTATSGTSIVLTTGASLNDTLSITVYDVFAVADTVSAQNGGTFSGAVSLTGGVSGDVDVTGTVTADGLTVDGNLSVDGGTIKLDGNYPVGANNVALGDSALNDITTGSYNTAIGHLSLANITTPDGNTGVGYYSLVSATTGSSNTAVGKEAIRNTTTGSFNTALGLEALRSNTTASTNTAVGYQAGLSITTGNGNTLIGYGAGDNITTGLNNIVIGDGTLAASTNSESIVIAADGTGAARVGKGSNTGYINAGVGGVYQGNNSSTWSTTSDERLKKNIVDNTDGLDKINAIRVRNFEYRAEDEISGLDPKNVIRLKGTQIGVIAQEIKQVCPQMVKEESTGVLSVDTDNLVWYLINAVKELSAKVEALENK